MDSIIQASVRERVLEFEIFSRIYSPLDLQPNCLRSAVRKENREETMGFIVSCVVALSLEAGHDQATAAETNVKLNANGLHPQKHLWSARPEE
jgi:hypothetical protein